MRFTFLLAIAALFSASHIDAHATPRPQQPPAFKLFKPSTWRNPFRSSAKVQVGETVGAHAVTLVRPAPQPQRRPVMRSDLSPVAPAASAHRYATEEKVTPMPTDQERLVHRMMNPTPKERQQGELDRLKRRLGVLHQDLLDAKTDVDRARINDNITRITAKRQQAMDAFVAANKVEKAESAAKRPVPLPRTTFGTFDGLDESPR